MNSNWNNLKNYYAAGQIMGIINNIEYKMPEPSSGGATNLIDITEPEPQPEPEPEPEKPDPVVTPVDREEPTFLAIESAAARELFAGMLFSMTELNVRSGL